jgi:hypothetical protein
MYIYIPIFLIACDDKAYVDWTLKTAYADDSICVP